jgi:hypothetical protein
MILFSEVARGGVRGAAAMSFTALDKTFFELAGLVYLGVFGFSKRKPVTA